MLLAKHCETRMPLTDTTNKRGLSVSGTDLLPGRVVTLIPSDDPEEKVWGVSYEIGESDLKQVLAHLDHREKDGYQRTPVMFYPQDPSVSPWELIIYLGLENNPFYAGPTDEDTVAEIIASASGPSGSNSEYLFQLAETMKNMGICDPHLTSIEHRVRSILGLVSMCPGIQGFLCSRLLAATITDPHTTCSRCQSNFCTVSNPGLECRSWPVLQ
ncbi:putative glutathione-specific gamma-glutamylcyclotransferase 2 [Macrobrachium nipponense]|uniref:putative glutathione-specific gamma-glutamylcyclotransferase 2 n=1 Tax=Macrobrachium nipponense TaxID=159736 RepID=UPI0030C82AE5